MKKAFFKISGLLLAVISICICFSVTGFAADEWTYADRLPNGISTDKYYIEYKNIYRTVAQTSPGSEWTNKGIYESRYENNGGNYESDFVLAVSPTRELVGCYYYHFCSAGTGNRVNFAFTDTYHHYDAVGGNVIETGFWPDDDDPRYTAYSLNVSCSSGVTCDGSYGYHGARSNIWYKKYVYQDKKKVDYYTFEKQSSWTSSRDTSATDYSVRYKAKHTHSYGDWQVSKKATLEKDGVRYRYCKTCKEKQTLPVYMPKTLKLSSTSCVYNGKVRTPSVKIVDRNGQELPAKRYDVTYSSGRKNIGTYKVKITFKGAFYSGSKTLTFKIIPGEVKNLKATPKKDSITLSWSQLAGSVQYRIYSYNPTKKEYTYVATTSSTSYTVKSLKSSTTYNYVVRGYKKVGDTAYSGKISSLVKAQPYGAPTKVTGLTCTEKNPTSVTLKWSKASGNNIKYYVYTYNSSTKKYTSVGSTTGTTLKLTGLKANTTYNYSVRAYSNAGGGYYGSRSSLLAVKTPKTPTIPLVKGLNPTTEGKLNHMLITWTKDSSVSGYQIYKSTTNKSDSYKKLKTLSYNYSSFVDTDIKPGTTYYYKMRAYKKVDGQTYYGSFNKIIYCTSYSAWKENPKLTDYTYSFGNHNSYFGYPSLYYIPKTSYQIVFGKTAFADAVYGAYKYQPWSGNCHGMCATSALMNVRTSGVTISSFSAGETIARNLGVNSTGSLGISLKQFIEAMQVSQYSHMLHDARVWNDCQALVDAVCWVPYTGKPVIVSVKSEADDFYHALLAYKAVKMSNKEIHIDIYDPNFPEQPRKLIIYTNTSGKATGWYYKGNDQINLGSGYATCSINHLTYDDYSVMWTRKGTFTSSLMQQNALMVNSSSISIYDGDNKLIGKLVDGKLVAEDDSVTLIEAEGFVGSENAPYMLCLPTDETYTVVNNDESIDMFEATMTNVDRSAEVSTEADTVTFTVSDKNEINEASVVAERHEEYEIVLDFSDCLNQEKIEVGGEGKGKTVVVTRIEDETQLKNCEESK